MFHAAQQGESFSAGPRPDKELSGLSFVVEVAAGGAVAALLACLTGPIE